MRWSGAAAGLRSRASPICSCGRSGTEPAVGLVQSTGTVRVAHWNPSPQSLQARVVSKAGSGGQLFAGGVVVVVVDVDGLGLGFAVAEVASAIDTTSATSAGRRRLTARRVRPRGWAGPACRGSGSRGGRAR